MRSSGNLRWVAKKGDLVYSQKFDLFIIIVFSVFYNFHNLRILISNDVSDIFVLNDNFYLNTINALSRDVPRLPLGEYDEVSNVGGIPINPFPLGEYLLAIVKSTSGLSLAQVYVTSTLALTILISLLFYKIISLFIDDRLIILPAVFSSIFFVFAGNYSLLRPINPSFNFLIWALFMYSILDYQRYIDRGFLKNLPHLIFAFCLLLSSPYYSFHAVFVYLYFIFVVVFPSETYQNRKGVFEHLAPIVFVAIMFVTINAWRLLNVSKISWIDYSARLGLVDSHFPSAKVVVILSLLGTLLVVWKKKHYQNLSNAKLLVFLNILVISLANSNVVTGKYLQFSDHFNQVSSFTFVLSLSFFLSKLSAIKEFRYLFVIPVLVLCSFLFMQQDYPLKPTIGTFEAGHPLNALSKELSRLDENPTIVSDLDLETLDLLSIHKDINLVFSGNTALYPIKNQEIVSRLFLYNRCEPISRDFLLANEPHVFVYSYSASYYKNTHFRDLLKNLGLDLSKDATKNRPVLDEFERYANDLDPEDCGKLLSDFGVDYVLTNSIQTWRSLIDGYVEWETVLEGEKEKYWLLKVS